MQKLTTAIQVTIAVIVTQFYEGKLYPVLGKMGKLTENILQDCRKCLTVQLFALLQLVTTNPSKSLQA